MTKKLLDICLEFKVKSDLDLQIFEILSYE